EPSRSTLRRRSPAASRDVLVTLERQPERDREVHALGREADVRAEHRRSLEAEAESETVARVDAGVKKLVETARHGADVDERRDPDALEPDRIGERDAARNHPQPVRG